MSRIPPWTAEGCERAARSAAQASGLPLDAILYAVCIHVAGRHGATRSVERGRSYGLAAWQEQRAKDMMDSHIDVSLSHLARESALSVAHFGQAFKRSTGMAPHQWQLGRRISRAQALLAATGLSIVEIALTCGFSSQSHFSTVFRERTGVKPLQWRRSAVDGGLDKG